MSESILPDNRDDIDTYGAHNLVDNSPIEEADTLLEECSEYIDDYRGIDSILSSSGYGGISANTVAPQPTSYSSLILNSIIPVVTLNSSNSNTATNNTNNSFTTNNNYNFNSSSSSSSTTNPTLPPTPNSNLLTRVAANVFNFRKKKDTRISTAYSIYLPRILVCEKKLRKVIGEVVEKKIILRLQARHLQARLEACINYNEGLLATTDVPLDDTRNFVNTLSHESAELKNMIAFNLEILRMQQFEEQQRNLTVLRYNRQNINNLYNENIERDDPDHFYLESRLEEFRKLREKFVDLLSAILQKRSVQLSNLENCTWSLDAIKKEGNSWSSSEVQDDPEASSDPSVVASANLKFDHSRCTDCGFVYSMACDCLAHIEALQKQAQDANKRLQMLVEVRERMAEAADAMAISQNNTVSTPTSSSSNSSATSSSIVSSN